MVPQRVQIGPFLFAIEMGETERTLLTDSHGETDLDKLIIRLHPDRADMISRETLLHEILHAVASVAGLDHELGAELEEKVVRRLAPILLDAFLRNSGLVKYLCGTNTNATAAIGPTPTTKKPNRVPKPSGKNPKR